MILRAHAVAAVALAALLTLAGCDEGQAFYILQNQIPGSGCVVSTDSTAYRTQGVLDVSMGEGYFLYPLLINELPARKVAGDVTGRAEPHLLHLREFRVEIDLGDIQQSFAPEQLSFTRPTSGAMPPGGKRSSVVEVLPQGLVRELKVAGTSRPTVVVNVVAAAETGTGDTLESLHFFYPITLCNGCLVRTLESCSGVDAQTGTNAGTSTSTNNTCGLPQDVPLVCCKEGSGLRCPVGL